MKIIAHRGGLETPFKPNTIPCLLYALNMSYIDGVELDVRLTKDKKVVIIHDPIINLVSNGSGIVKDMTLRKLKKSNFGTKEYPILIGTLPSFLEQVDVDKMIMIELKDNNTLLADRVYKIIRKYCFPIYIASFHYELLLYFQKKYHYPCGLIIGLGQNTERLYNHFDYNVVTYHYKTSVSHKKKTFLWTINQKKEGLSSFYVITDYPSNLAT